MSRILVVGWELPQFAPEMRMEAANFRTAQFIQALSGDGHELCLAAGRIGQDFPGERSPTQKHGILYVPLRFSNPRWIRRLHSLYRDFHPDAIVGVTFQGSLRATRLRNLAPLWLDIYGDPIAEIQAFASQHQSDRGIATGLRFLQKVLHDGDVYSTCSTPQRYALIGQLSTVGRLNRSTFGSELVYAIPPAATAVEPSAEPGGIRGTFAGDDHCIVLWCGGYNNWTDVETLFRGLDYAMAMDPQIRFVSVGGPAAGSNAFDRFNQLIKHSTHRDRFIMLGWKPVSQVARYYRDADIAVTLDSWCYEAELGTRTRLVEMMQYGLPIVTTRACELSHQIETEGLGYLFQVGDWRGLAEQLQRLSANRDLRQSIAERSMRYVGSTLSLEESTAPLRRWAQQPSRARDHQRGVRDRLNSLEYRARSMLRGVLWSAAGLER